MVPDESGTQLAVLVDRVAIDELTARYNRLFDDLDVGAWVDTFTEDGVMSLDGRRWSGRDALKRLIERVGYGMVHVTTNPIVTIDGDEAVQECSMLLFRRRPDRSEVRLITTGRYRDELVRTPRGWRFRRRVARTDSPVAM